MWLEFVPQRISSLPILKYFVYFVKAHTTGWVNKQPQYDSIGNLGASSRTMYGLCTSYTSVTGYIMIALLLLGICLTPSFVKRVIPSNRKTYKILMNYYFFKTTHRAMAVGFVSILLVHPLPTLPTFDGTKSFGSVAWVFLALPILLTFLSLIWILYNKRLSKTYISSCEVVGEVVILRMPKPRQNRPWTPGCYVKCLIPSISRIAWHPFSVTSDSKASIIQFHVKSRGDWTSELLNKARTGSLVSCHAYLEGPYATSTAEYRNYENMLLIGGGIGVTPFISIILDMINGNFKSNRVKQVQLRWLVRDLHAARFWFQDLFQSIEDDNGKSSNCPSIAVTIWYTKNKQCRHDLSTAMRTVGYVYSDLFGSDLISGITIRSGTIRAEFGRPESWKSVFQSCYAAYGQSKKIGVFYSGPHSLREELRTVCHSISPRSTFEYHSENCF